MKKIIHREIETQIISRLFETGKVIIIYGARQVGKTTIAKQILQSFGSSDGYYNCEEKTVQDILLSRNSKSMHSYFAGHKVIVLDEAQSVLNIGLSLKILIDAYPEMSIIVTGSSSFDLANRINEPLTGRHYQYTLYPISFAEMAKTFGNRYLIENLNQRIIYGNYPEIVLSESLLDIQERLRNLSSSYLYRDLFKFTNIKSPDVLFDLLRALAHQVGSEVSVSELSTLLSVDRKTVTSYIELLEQAFIIFRLKSYSNNMRNEIKKGMKVYFYDNGIICSLTQNFTNYESGRDMGGLWENLMISERVKRNQYKGNYANQYFWRKQGYGEIDYIEQKEGKLSPFEFKYTSSKIQKASLNFVQHYASNPIQVINRTNYLEFVTE